MQENKTLDIIKGAMLLEYRGKALYESAAQTTKVDAVKELFEFLVKEEETHIDILKDQFTRVHKKEGFDVEYTAQADLKAQSSSKILSDKIVNGISGAGYEAAVISAALEFEKNAVKYYSDHSAQAGSEEEKKLYDWLAEWEKGHMTMLAELDNEIKEQIWYDNQFWPLD